MKVLKCLLFALTVFSLSACFDDEESSCTDFDYSGKTTLSISGVIKVEEGQSPINWPGKSDIGVYAFTSGQDYTGASIYKDKSNIKYTSLSETVVAKFTSAKETDAIQLKEGSLDVKAYYPFKEGIKDFNYPIDLNSDKSVYYASNVKNVQPKGKIELIFTQMLSKLKIKVIAGENVNSLANMQSTPLQGGAVKGNLNLATGLVAVEDANIGNIPVVLANGAKESTVTAAMLPGQPLNKLKVVFTVDNKQYTWSISEAVIAEAGKQHVYEMTINADGSWTVVPQGEIIDWNEGNADGDVNVIIPDGNGGGTLNPDGDIKDWDEGGGDSSVITPEDSDKDVPVGGEVLVMNETWGVNVTDRWDLKNEMFNTYTGFDTKGVTFSNEGTRLSARALNTVRDENNKFDKHIWFPRFDDNLDGKKPTTPTLAIRNINTANLKDITITYSILGDMRTTMKEYINTTFVKVYADGEKLKVPSVDLFSTEYSSKYYTITLKVDKPFSELVFKTDMSNYTGIRLDNVIIKGIKVK